MYFVNPQGVARSVSTKAEQQTILIDNAIAHHQLVVSRRSTVVSKPLGPLPDDRKAFLQGEMGKWDANVRDMSLDEQVHYLEMLFLELGVLQEFNVPENRLRVFLLTIRSLYHAENPYHNFTHAADVASTIVFIMRNTDAMATLTPLDVFAIVVAAIAHDVDHPGVNQSFERAMRSDIALQHNFRSTLENHHLNVLLSVLKLDMANIFANLTQAQYVECIDTIIDGVLATDISKHFELTSHISGKMKQKDFKLPSKRLDDRRICTMALLKMSDVSNPMKPFDTAAWWADVVLKEFHAQGDLEASLGLPISPLCDRNQSDLASSQIGFSSFVVRPFYALCTQLFKGLDQFIDIGDENLTIWSQKKEQVALESARRSSVDTDSSEIRIELDPVQDFRDGKVLGLDMDALIGMTDEEVALQIMQSQRGGHKQIQISGDLQSFVDTIQDRTDAVTAVLYWRDIYSPGTLKRVAVTSGFATCKETIDLSEIAGIMGAAAAKKEVVRAMCDTLKSDSGAEVLADSKKIEELCIGNRRLDKSEKSSYSMNHNFDGAFTRAMIVTPILGPDGELKGLLQVRNKAAPEGSKARPWDKGRRREKRVSDGSAPFTHADELFMSWCINQVRDSLEANVNQKIMTERINMKLEDKDATSEGDSAEADLIDIVDTFVNEARLLLGADRSSVFLIDNKTEERNQIMTVGRDCKDVIRLPIGVGIAGTCVKDGVSILIDDAYNDVRFDQENDTKSGYITKTILCVPITGSSGDVLGAVQMINKAEGPFTEEDNETLHSLVSKATMAIEKARLTQDVRMMLEANSLMNSELDLTVLLAKMMNQAKKLLRADRCAMFLVDFENQMFRSTVATGLEDSGKQEIAFPISQGIAGKVYKENTTLMTADAYTIPEFNKDTDAETGYTTRSLLAMPVCDTIGAVIGVIQMVNKSDGEGSYSSFSNSDEVVMRKFVQQAAVALTNSRLFGEMLQSLSAMTTLVRAMPDYSITLDKELRYLTSTIPLASILSAYPNFTTLKLAEDERVLNWNVVCDELAEDIKAVLNTSKAVTKPEGTLEEESFVGTVTGGYCVVPIWGEGPRKDVIQVITAPKSKFHSHLSTLVADNATVIFDPSAEAPGILTGILLTIRRAM